MRTEAQGGRTYDRAQNRQANHSADPFIKRRRRIIRFDGVDVIPLVFGIGHLNGRR